MKNLFWNVWLGIWACMPLCVSAQSSETATDTLRLITFNIRYDNPGDGENCWVNRRKACLDMLHKYSPDVFGVQEALPNQMEDLRKGLPEYGCVGRGRAPHTSENEHAAVFYRKDKFVLEDSATFWLSTTPDTVSVGWDAKLPRVATWVRLRDKRKHKELLYLNAHLDHKGSDARTSSAQLIVDELKKKMDRESLPVFVTGDFNALPESVPVETMRGFLKDLRKEVEPGNTEQTVNGWGTEPPHKIIDYIFYRDSKPLEYKVVTENFGVPYISDHFPVYGAFVY